MRLCTFTGKSYRYIAVQCCCFYCCCCCFCCCCGCIAAKTTFNVHLFSPLSVLLFGIFAIIYSVSLPLANRKVEKQIEIDCSSSMVLMVGNDSTTIVQVVASAMVLLLAISCGWVIERLCWCWWYFCFPPKDNNSAQQFCRRTAVQ